MEYTTEQFKFKEAAEIAQEVDVADKKNTTDVVWQFILAFYKVNMVAPFLSEICEALDVIQEKTPGTTSKGTVKGQIDKLVALRKIITPTNRRRSHGRIHIVGSTWVPPQGMK